MVQRLLEAAILGVLVSTAVVRGQNTWRTEVSGTHGGEDLGNGAELPDANTGLHEEHRREWRYSLREDVNERCQLFGETSTEGRQGDAIYSREMGYTWTVLGFPTNRVSSETTAASGFRLYCRYKIYELPVVERNERLATEDVYAGLAYWRWSGSPARSGYFFSLAGSYGARYRELLVWLDDPNDYVREQVSWSRYFFRLSVGTKVTSHSLFSSSLWTRQYAYDGHIQHESLDDLSFYGTSLEYSHRIWCWPAVHIIFDVDALLEQEEEMSSNVGGGISINWDYVYCFAGVEEELSGAFEDVPPQWSVLIENRFRVGSAFGVRYRDADYRVAGEFRRVPTLGAYLRLAM